MTFRAAVFDADGVTVSNVILLAAAEDAPAFNATVLADDTAVGPGWALVDGDWVAPEPADPEPPSLTPMEALQAQIDALTDLLLEM